MRFYLSSGYLLNLRQYNMLVDRFARQKERRPEFVLETFFGQLEHLFCIRLPECRDLGINTGTTILIAAIRTSVMDKNLNHKGLGLHPYSRLGALNFVDLMNVQCLVGRVRDRNHWTILDRSGTLARAVYTDDE